MTHRQTLEGSTTIVGAGIIGLCIAIRLTRAGFKVTVLDTSLPGTGASFGNGGLISVDTMQPIAVPGMLRHVPGWLSDPSGPVTVKPSYVLAAAPWLWQWIRAGRMDRVRAASHALRQLHKDAYDGYRDLLGPALFQDLIKASGVVQVWESEHESRSDIVAQQLRDMHEIKTNFLSQDDLRQMFPGISSSIKRGILLTRNGYTVNPGRLTSALAEILVREGGSVRLERVMKILPQGGDGFNLITNTANHRTGRVVIAAGAWSKSLLKPLRVSLPLEAERGYHLLLQDCSLKLQMPVMHRGRGFGLTPMEDGMCLSGTVEFGGVHAPPSEHRALVLKNHAEKVFPEIGGTIRRIWMGLRPSLPDSIPAIGRVPSYSDLFVAVGHGHYGMTGAPSTGKLLMEIIENRPPHIEPNPYALERFC